MSQKHVAILMESKRLIADGTYDFVCVTLGCDEYSLEIKRHIEHLIEGCYTLEDWIQQHLDLDEAPDCDSDEMRQTRLAWIDWLIEYWKDQP